MKKEREKETEKESDKKKHSESERGERKTTAWERNKIDNSRKSASHLDGSIMEANYSYMVTTDSENDIWRGSFPRATFSM